MQELKKVGQGYKLISYEFNKQIVIPGNWALMKLTETCDILDAQRIPIEESERKRRKGNFPYYGASGIIDCIDDFIFNEKLLCLAEDGENLRSRVLPVAFIIEGKTWVNNHAHVLKPKANVADVKYLEYFLNHKKYEKYLSFTAQPKLTQEEMKKILVILPPLIEQRKIASILSKVHELIKKIDQIIEETQRLKKGLMKRLFTKGTGHNKFKNTVCGDIPVGWEVCAIGEKCKVGSGGTPSRTNPSYFSGNIPWVKTTELKYNTILDTEEKITERAITESSAKVYPKGTFVIAMVGLEAVGTRGKCAILGIDAAVNQACAAIQMPTTINTYFLFYYYQTIVNRVMSLVAGTKRQNLNLELVKSIKIPIPHIEEQEKIVSIISNMDKYIQNQKANPICVKISRKV